MSTELLFPPSWGQPHNGRRFVSSDGPIPCDVMLIGEGPGKHEAHSGQCFVGPAGETLDTYLWRIGMARGSVYVTNLVKYRVSDGPKDEPPTAEDVDRDWQVLKWEIETCRPSTIICLGGPATRALIDTQKVPHPMDAINGRPIMPEEFSSRLMECAHIPERVIGVIHPAAGLRDQDLAGKCYMGMVLAERWVMRGQHPFSFDEARPDPEYRRITDAGQLRSIFATAWTYIKVDTEGPHKAPWMLSFSVRPGEGWIIYAEDADLLELFNLLIQDMIVVLHNALHDLRVLRAMGVHVKRFEDTMIATFNTCGEPQGLKGLSWRVAGIHMNEYEDVVGPYAYKKALAYLEDMRDKVKLDACGVTVEGKKHSPYRRLRDAVNRIYDGQVLEAEEEEDSDADADSAEKLSPDKKLRKWWRGGTKTGFPREWSQFYSAVYGDMPEVQREDVPEKELIPYSGMDADATGQVFPYIMKQIKDLKLEQVYETDMKVVPMLDAMQENGMPLDLTLLFQLEKELKTVHKTTSSQLAEMCGPDFNARSGDHVANFLFGKLGVEIKKLTKSGKRAATDDKVMEAIVVDLLKACGGDPSKLTGRDQDVHRFVKLEQDFREEDKLLGTFILPLWDVYDKSTGRVHPNWRSTRVVSGRLATHNPNLLAFPARSEWGRRVRSAFKCRPGHVLISFDLDQIEMRTMASEAADDGLISAFFLGQDVHWANAAMIFRKQYEELTKWSEKKAEWVEVEKGGKLRYRTPAKNIGFGVLYGITYIGLQAQMFLQGLDYTAQECQDLIDRWYGGHEAIRKYMREAVNETRRNGFVRDRWGRIRRLPGVWSELGWIRAEAERQVGNFKIQAAAQGVIKRAMIRIWENVLPELARMGYDVRPLLQIHDELIFEMPDDENCIAIASELILDEMKRDSELFIVPVTSKGVTGASWGDLKD